MSRAMPKSPILATRPAPLQVNKQFRAAMSLKRARRESKVNAHTGNMQTYYQNPPTISLQGLGAVYEMGNHLVAVKVSVTELGSW